MGQGAGNKLIHTDKKTAEQKLIQKIARPRFNASKLAAYFVFFFVCVCVTVCVRGK